MRWLLPAVVLVLTGLVLCLFTEVRRLNKLVEPSAAGAESLAPRARAVSDDEQVEVAVYMERLQTWSHKFWAAGHTGNLELAKFYLEEVEETMEALAAHKVIEDGKDLGELMRTYGLKSVEHIEEQLETKGLSDLDLLYEGLVNSCNSCHVASGYDFIRVQVPTVNRYTDQVFTP